MQLKKMPRNSKVSLKTALVRTTSTRSKSILKEKGRYEGWDSARERVRSPLTLRCLRLDLDLGQLALSDLHYCTYCNFVLLFLRNIFSVLLRTIKSHKRKLSICASSSIELLFNHVENTWILFSKSASTLTLSKDFLLESWRTSP